MNVAVFRTAKGPVQVFLLTDPEAPATAHLPGIDVASAFLAKGPGMSWEGWTERLAAVPALGNWALEQVPDNLTEPSQVLAFVRLRELRDNLVAEPD